MNPVSAIRKRVADLPIIRKFVLLCTLLTLGIIVLAVAAARLQYTGLVDGRKQQVKTQVDMGMDIIQHFAGKAERGEMDTAQAKAAAIAALATVKTNGGTDYFFIIDPQMNVVMHPSVPPGSTWATTRAMRANTCTATSSLPRVATASAPTARPSPACRGR